MILRHCCVQDSRLLVYVAVRTWYSLYVSSSLFLCDNYILPMMSADERFVKADSRNLLKVNIFMIGEYLNKNYCYNVAEVQSVKAQRLFHCYLQCCIISIYKGAFWFATYFYYRMMWQHQ
jgi:hypothetical protein